MWLINSSVGKKVVMSVTGICLILFLTFHALMNSVALFSKDGYNAVCEFLGTNWYALVGTLGLAALAVLHLIYAFVLTIQNRKARGQNRYFVTAKPEKVEWASQNMFVLGVIIVLGLLLHLFNFWYNMMFAELVGNIGDHVPTDGYAYIVDTFSNPVFTVLYIIWLVALWFHLSHGFWSSLQTLGLNGKTWLKRWQCIGIVWVTIIVGLLLLVVLKFALCGGAC
ncbi:MAG: succinate dehydrogenase/fumarate reductase cytochrome b subunit [Prevotellaceae bacterium]|nr:succinate dehydrogenase/fumarate reductase cytochrome b subunit [Prevotellaceae bacterium]MDY3856232.1 succinate dehydrogenase/fumarate reductase cytochrome b subunit [Bacteroidaceae bacterium]